MKSRIGDGRVELGENWGSDVRRAIRHTKSESGNILLIEQFIDSWAVVCDAAPARMRLPPVSERLSLGQTLEREGELKRRYALG